MNWYKIAQTKNDVNDVIVWKCPSTGISIKAPRLNKDILEYGLYMADGSFVDSFSSWYGANREAKKINWMAEISKSGEVQK